MTLGLHTNEGICNSQSSLLFGGALLSLPLITRSRLHHHGTGPSSSENVPVGPSSSRSARRRGSCAACWTVRVPWKLLKVRRGEARARSVDFDACRLEIGGEGERDRVERGLR